MEFSEVDLKAIEEFNSNYLLNKGAEYYKEEDYEKAIEYYRIAASMGNFQAVSNLGYCYMYGRSIEKNDSIALAYFTLAARHGVIDAIYKLGNIYKDGLGVNPNIDLAMYYYEYAINKIRMSYDESEEDYPSLYYQMAKEKMPGGCLVEDLHTAYEYLIIARDGYMFQIENGAKFYVPYLRKVEELMADNVFDGIRDDHEDED